MCVCARANAVVAVRSKWGDVGGWAPHSGRGLRRGAETWRVGWVVAGSVYWSSEKRSSPDSLSPFPILSLSLSLLHRTPRWTSIYTVFRPRATFSSLGFLAFCPLPLPLPLSLLTPFAQITPRWCPRHGRSAVVAADRQTPTTNYRRPGGPIPTFSTLCNLHVCFFPFLILSPSPSLPLSHPWWSVRIPLIGESRSLLRGYTDRMQGALRIDAVSNPEDKLSQKTSHYYGVSF